MAARGTSFKRSFKNEEWREPGEGYNGPTPTRGIYPAKLVTAEEHTSSGGGESTHWVFELLEGAEGKNGDSYAGWRGHVYTNDEGAAWKEQQVLVAIGVMEPNGTINSTLEQILKRAKPCKVRLQMEKYVPEDGEEEAEMRAKVATVLRDDEAAPAKRSRRGKAADDDDVEDDEPFDDEDDEEDEPAPRSRRSRAKKAEPEEEPEDEEEDEDEDDEPEEGEEEGYDPDELAEELEALTLLKLKKRATEEFSISAAKLRGKKAEAIIDMIIDTLPEEDEEDEEPEEEPEPPARARRSAGKKAAPAATTRKRRSRGSDDEPPF